MKGPGTTFDTSGAKGQGQSLFPTVYLPAEVTDVPREAVRAFSHNKRVGTYLLGRSLGEGSFAKVKESLHVPTGEKVAVKVIDKKRAKADPYVRKNLRREGRLLQQVRHQHVVQLLEVLETEHSYYLVTEYCAGGDLMDYIAKRKRLDEREVKKFIRQIVSAVDYLHRLGIIHRDLKIENLLLDQHRDIKLIDFGLSNTIKVNTAPEGSAHAQEYLVTQCGSPAYAAPELLNHRKYGLQVDVWSIGVNMYAMLTGSLPFTVDPFNIKTLYNKMVSGQMNPFPDSLSREGKDILKKFLTADPEKRLTIAEALRHPWLSEGRNKPVERPPFPNKLKTSELDMDILKHMSDNLGFRMSEVIRFVVGNVPSSACSTYFLYHRKLTRHRADQRSKGKAPAEAKHVEPTRISLVLQDMTPWITNPGAPTRQLRVRADSSERESLTSRETHGVNGVNGQRRSTGERTGTTTTTPSTDKDSVAGKDRTFLSSLEHSLDDVRSETKENKSRGAGQGAGQGAGGQFVPSPSPLTIAATPDTAASGSRRPFVGRTATRAQPTNPALATPRNKADPASTPPTISSIATPRNKEEPSSRHAPKTVTSTAASPPSSTVTSPRALPESVRRGRVLVPLGRMHAPLRRGGGGGGVGVGVGGGSGGGAGVVRGDGGLAGDGGSCTPHDPNPAAVAAYSHGHGHDSERHRPTAAGGGGGGVATAVVVTPAPATPREGTRIIRGTHHSNNYIINNSHSHHQHLPVATHNNPHHPHPHNTHNSNQTNQTAHTQPSNSSNNNHTHPPLPVTNLGRLESPNRSPSPSVHHSQQPQSWTTKQATPRGGAGGGGGAAAGVRRGNSQATPSWRSQTQKQSEAATVVTRGGGVGGGGGGGKGAVVVVSATGGGVTGNRLAASDPHHHPQPRLVANDRSAKDAFHKRPVSPQPQPLVRRRLAKRSRQDGQGLTSEGARDERGAHHVITSDAEESVTVERLVTSPDHHRVASVSVRSSSLSQSEDAAVARDLHMLPAISTVVTPRH